MFNLRAIASAVEPKTVCIQFDNFYVGSLKYTIDGSGNLTENWVANGDNKPPAFVLPIMPMYTFPTAAEGPEDTYQVNTLKTVVQAND